MWYSEHQGKHRKLTFEEYVKIQQEYGTSLGHHIIRDHRISTVWLGLDHGDGGLPVIYETMVFFKDSGEDFQCRYSYFKDAIKGHAKIVKIVRYTLGVENILKKLEDI